MRQRRNRWVSVAIIVGLAGYALAERSGAPATTYATMATGAVQLMPSHFKKILMQRQNNLLNAVNASYRADAEGEDRAAAERIETQVERIKARLAENVPFNSLVAEYGVLVRLVAELEDPARHAPAPTSAALQKEFHTLLEKKSAKLPTVFYGYDATLFQKRDLKSFLNGIAQRSQIAGERLAKTYATDGRVKTFADADDRSPAFGIAALYYSHTISDVANIWLYIWWESYGDMRGTPFFDNSFKP